MLFLKGHIKKPRGRKAAVGNFGVNINNFLCFYLEKCHNAQREYGEISVFSHHASVFRIGKNLISPILLEFYYRVQRASLIGLISDALCTLCSDRPIYAALLRDR